MVILQCRLVNKQNAIAILIFHIDIIHLLICFYIFSFHLFKNYGNDGNCIDMELSYYLECTSFAEAGKSGTEAICQANGKFTIIIESWQSRNYGGYVNRIIEWHFRKGGPLENFFNSWSPTDCRKWSDFMPKIWCNKKRFGLYRFHVQALRFMMVKNDFAYDYTLKKIF